MNWLCKKCRTVTVSKEHKCCGEVVEFNPAEHGFGLISGSNGWARINKQWFEKWRDHPLIAEASSELTESGCHSAPIHIIHAVDRLIEFYDEHTAGDL